VTARAVRALDAQLGALTSERNQHRLLHQVCDALGELGKLGGAQLFWGTAEAVTTGEDQLGRVRGRVTAFESRVGELEARRQSTREQIDKEQHRAGLIEDELFEAQEEEERLRHEWIVEREISGLHSRPLIMPWTWGGEDDRRFQKSLLGALAVCLILTLIFPLIRLPLQRAPEDQEAPPFVAAHLGEPGQHRGAFPDEVQEQRRPEPFGRAPATGPRRPRRSASGRRPAR